MSSVEVVNWFREQSKETAEAVLAICQDVTNNRPVAEVKAAATPAKRGRGPGKKNKESNGAPPADKAQGGSGFPFGAQA